MSSSLKRLSATALAATAFTALAAVPASAQTIEAEDYTLVLDTIAEGLENPWGLDFLPDGSMLVTERPGRLRHVAADGTLSDPIVGVPEVDARGQGGLLDVEIGPDFETERWVYLSFAEPGENDTNSTAVARGRLSEDFSSLDDLEIVFSQQPKLASTLHYGSRIVFDDEGYMFITAGERSNAEFRVQAQDLDSHLGKVIRLWPDGTVPEDNPFVGQDGAFPEIYSYGHRNPQGAAIFPATGQLWAIEHGPRGGDELNRIEAGGNYGWPLLTEGTEYSGDPIDPPAELPQGLIDPVAVWVPSPAPSGLLFYTGDAFPEWQGDAFFGALAGTSLVRVAMDGEEVTGDEFLMTDLGMRIRAVEQAPDGTLYLLTDSATGEILRLSPQ